jgi:hypothetical protein
LELFTAIGDITQRFLGARSPSRKDKNRDEKWLVAAPFNAPPPW